MDQEEYGHSCSDCGVFHCDKQNQSYPGFCLTKATPEQEIEEVAAIYREDPLVARIFHAAAEVEGLYYGKLTRAEEIVTFAKRIGAKKLGVATCMGLINESKTFTRMLKAKGLEGYCCVACKVGALDKALVGIEEEIKINPGQYEAICNPILQARILNSEKTDLNVIVGLCVGHDSLFIKYSDAPVTTLITKDRVLAHNPAAALYTTGSYYRRLLQEE